jgi:hypothetical protein
MTAEPREIPGDVVRAAEGVLQNHRRRRTLSAPAVNKIAAYRILHEWVAHTRTDLPSETKSRFLTYMKFFNARQKVTDMFIHVMHNEVLERPSAVVKHGYTLYTPPRTDVMDYNQALLDYLDLVMPPESFDEQSVVEVAQWVAKQ